MYEKSVILVIDKITIAINQTIWLQCLFKGIKQFEFTIFISLFGFIYTNIKDLEARAMCGKFNAKHLLISISKFVDKPMPLCQVKYIINFKNTSE